MRLQVSRVLRLSRAACRRERVKHKSVAVHTSVGAASTVQQALRVDVLIDKATVILPSVLRA